MRAESVLTRLKPRKPVTSVAFVVLLLPASTTFGLTAAGHYSTMESGKVTGTVVDYHLTEDEYGTVIVAQVKVHNPLLRPILVAGAGLTGTVDGTVVALSGGLYQGVTVPAQGTKVVAVRLRPLQDQRSAAVAAVKSGELRIGGSVYARIEEYRFSFNVFSGTGADDE